MSPRAIYHTKLIGYLGAIVLYSLVYGEWIQEPVRRLVHGFPPGIRLVLTIASLFPIILLGVYGVFHAVRGMPDEMKRK